MATGAPPGVPHGPGQVPGEGAGAGGGVEVVGEPLKGQLSGGGATASGYNSGEQSGSLKSQPAGDPVPLGVQSGAHLQGVFQAGPQVSVAGHIQHVSVAGQVQQAGGGGEVTVSGGNGVVPPGGDGDDLPQKRKATSFKITNVFLSRPPSNDGDDSCDDNEDLEDSHTEDLSDIADSLNSLSSQLESVAALNNPVNGTGGGQGGQPQAPPPAPGSKSPRGQAQQSSKEGGSVSRKTSSVGEFRRPSLAADKLWENSLPPYTHPGFGFVTYQHTGGATYPVSYVDKATGYLPVAGTMAVINNVEKGGVSEVPVSSQAVAGPQDFRTRFKIVKVETTIPLKRGRWTCFDFVDKPAAKDPKEKELQPEVSKPVTSVTTTKPVTATKASGEKSNSRPNSAVPKEEVCSESSAPPRVESVEVQGEAEKRLVGQTEPPPVASIVSGSVSEERELDTGKSVTMGHSSRLTNSVPPDGLRNVSYPNASYPTPSVTVASSSTQATTVQAQQGNSMNISLPQPVVMPGAVAVQSPHGGVRPDFPQVQAIQGSLGQVVRLPDGQLAQVALQPLQQPGGQQQPQQQQPQHQQQPQQQPQQTQQSQQQPQGSQTQQQQQVLLQRIPNSNNHSHSLAPQQQVVVNAQGQHFIVQQQQQQNISQQQPGRSQAAQQTQSSQQPQPQQQQQPSKKLSQQPQQGVSTAGAPQSQQNQFNSSSGAAVAPSNLPTATPMQPQPAAGPVPVPQGQAGPVVPPTPAQPQQPPVAAVPGAAQPLPGTQPAQQSGAGAPVQVTTIKRTGVPGVVTPAQPPASTVATAQPSQQPARPSTTSQPAPLAQSNNNSSAQPASSMAGPGQSLQSNGGQTGQSAAGQIGQSAAGQIGQSVAHIGQSIAQPVQNSTKAAAVVAAVSSAAQQSLVSSSLSQPSTVQSVAISTSQATPATSLNTFYPFSHTVYSGAQVVGQVENSYGLVAAGVGLDGEGLVERLEDLVSTQFGEEGKEGELENESASGAGQGSIDNRIEQAMDLVKSHLMSAVRSEVEELRDKISKLEDTVTILSRENEVLRANVNPDVLASLTGNRNLVGGMNSIPSLPCQPPDPHPALQPPNQH